MHSTTSCSKDEVKSAPISLLIYCMAILVYCVHWLLIYCIMYTSYLITVQIYGTVLTQLYI
jgi:hypothetical protein